MVVSSLLDHLQHLIANARNGERIALAVSGGADSMALMHLMADALGADAAGCLIVLTVDHGLRPESAVEAETVAARAEALGLTAHVLTWEGDKPITAIESTARDVRYRLLTGATRAAGASTLVTAHTASDQAETLLMRLARGSGIDGLSGMALETEVHGVRLSRPLLSVSRHELIAYLKARGLTWFDDPSNDDPAFERVRLRKKAEELRLLGLSAAPLSRSAERLARARAALEAETDAKAPLIGSADPAGSISLQHASWSALADEFRLRLLARAIHCVTGDPSPVNLSQLEAAAAALTAPGARGQSLHGAVIRVRKTEIFVMRETGRNGLPELLLEPGSQRIWDRRFAVSLAAMAPGPALIRAATLPELQSLAMVHGSLGVPRRSWRVVPVFVGANGSVFAAPLLALPNELATCRLLANWLSPSPGFTGHVAGLAPNP